MRALRERKLRVSAIYYGGTRLVAICSNCVCETTLASWEGVLLPGDQLSEAAVAAIWDPPGCHNCRCSLRGSLLTVGTPLPAMPSEPWKGYA